MKPKAENFAKVARFYPQPRSLPSVVLLGMNPSAAETIRAGSALDRLGQWMKNIGVTECVFLNCSTVPGAFQEKTVDKQKLRDTIQDDDCVIALGRVPGGILRKLGIDHFEMPHPSPRNRKLNDPEYERRMLDECREYVRKNGY